MILLSGVLVPLLLGLIAARDPRPRRGLAGLLVSFVVFELGYAFLIYYVWLRLSD
jgi:hypothetical protein